MPEAVALALPGRSISLKWHRLRRQAADPAFMLDRLVEGMLAGASLEVDLRCHAGGGFAVLHDERLERETTGRGAVAGASPEELRALFRRDNDGSPIEERVSLLDDIAGLVSRHRTHPFVVQLDVKDGLDRMTPAVAAAFAGLLAPLGRRFVLSGNDWQAIERLGARVPGLALGYDPCELPEARIASAADAAAFVAASEAVAPAARIIYLDYHIILAALGLGYDLVDAFHRRGRKVDAWTLNSDHPGAAKSLAALVRLGVDQVTTDEPAKLEKIWLGLRQAAQPPG